MDEDDLVHARQITCDHGKHKLYTQRDFDVLNGFEFVYTRCLNCHKIINLEAKDFTNH